MIASMYWLSRFGALIDSGKQLVMVYDPSGGLVAIYGEGKIVDSTICSSTRERQCLHHKV